MLTYVTKVVVFGLCVGEFVLSQTTLPSAPWPEERGLILGVNHIYNDPDSAQLRFLPFYPGLENYNGSTRGINFTNIYLSFKSFDVDFRSRTIYLYDDYLRGILVGRNISSEFNMAYMTFTYMHVGVSKGTTRVAVDWLSNTVYWTDSVFRWILAAPGDEEKIDLDLYKIIAEHHLDAPAGLSVDPIEGYLFWSDNGEHPKIERSNLDGTNRHTIITKHLQSPLSLETDIVDKRIYWIDSETEAVISAKYDGSDVTMVTRVLGTVLHDIAIFRDIIYLVESKNDNLLTINKNDGKREAAVISLYEAIYSVAVYGEEKQPLKQDQTDQCAELNCSQLCLTNKNGTSCACAEGYILNTTTFTCEELYGTSHRAIVYANTTHICLVDIRVIANFSYEPHCIYSVFSQKNITTPAPLFVRKKREAKSSTPATTPALSTTAVPTLPPPTVAPGDLLKMFDLDMKNRIVYFVTAGNTIYSRPIDMPLSNDNKEIMSYAAGNVSGLSFDAEDGNNLYWCEYDTGNFYVINVRDAAVTKIIPKGANNAQVTVRNPVSLLVLLEQRKLAWLAGNTSMSIQTMNLDGTDHQVLLAGSKMGSLIADREQKVFYYLVLSSYSARIYTVSFDGSKGPTYVNYVDRSSYLLLLYQSYFVWVYTPNDYGYVVNTNDRNTKTDIANGYFENGTKLVDMKVLDPKLQTFDKISPCVLDNGGCSQVCITRYTNNIMTKTCECKLGYTLDSDGKTCKSVGIVDDNFIIVADWTNEALYQIDLTADEVHAIPISSVNLVTGVFYDSGTKKVVWGEYYQNEIFSANLNGTVSENLRELDSGYPYRFAKDEATGNLFYTSLYWQKVGLITPNGKNVILNNDFYWEDLGDIVVHPVKGYIFYTVYDSPISYVARCHMDGKNVTRIINTDGYPDGLAIDYTSDRLFWSDAEHDTIQSCDFDGTDCQTLVNISSDQPEQIRDLETDGQYLYYCSYAKDYVIRLSLKSPDEREVIGRNTGFGKLDTMSMYKSRNMNVQPESGMCKARGGLGDCSSICVPVPEGRTCLCEDGVDLKPDGRACENVHQCDEVIIQQGTDDEDIEITIDSSCLRYSFDNCTYRCPKNYVPANSSNTLLTCTVDGWDIYTGRVNQSLCEEIRCPATIENGALIASCDRRVGETCEFTCNDGYVKTMEKTVCAKDGTFHKDTAEFCAPKTCPETIPHGSLNSDCTRAIGSLCTVTCDKFYTPSGGALNCTKDGWHVDINMFCQALHCPTTIENGAISAECNREVGKSCSFLCNNGYTATDDAAFCTQTGMYHKDRTEFCKEVSVVPVTPETQTASEPSSLSSGAIAGLTILAVAVVVLIVVIFVLVWRARSRSSHALYDTASFHNDDRAVPETGYVAFKAPAKRAENPYSSTIPN